MITNRREDKELIVSLDETWNELLELISLADESLINKIPFKDSWTIAQLATHITKSNVGMLKVLIKQGKLAERNPALGEANMKKIFLDFDTKYQSPEFIIPEVKVYDKRSVVNDLESSIQQLKEEHVKQDLSQLLTVEIFGEVTKLELYYFILYHTQRHIHQLKNILKEL